MQIEDSQRPIGASVEPRAVRRPERTVIDGRFVRLEPLDAARHAPALWRNVQGDQRVWDYLFDVPPPDLPSLEADLARKAASDDPLFWTIVDRVSGEAQGYATLMRVEPGHRVIEVGNILFTPALQRKPGATEAMSLLAGHVFDDLGYRRYEWKCNALNAPSRAAALRLGFTFEGVFRQHMIVKGRNRDTAWFSMLDTEWPRVKRGFAAWLAQDNFDTEGRQRRPLSEMRDEAVG